MTNFNYQIQTIHRSKTGLFSDVSNKISYQQEEYFDFFSYPFNIENIEKQIKIKKSSFRNRSILLSVLSKKYENISTTEKVKNNILSLESENTFTICTGHQLCLLTGPLYFVIKILHTIQLCEVAKKHYPQYNFVPIYWMASEDHDFDEISFLHLFKEKIIWEKEVKNRPISHLDNDGINEVIEKCEKLFSTIEGTFFNDLKHLFSSTNYSNSFFEFINVLFSNYGLVILDANDKELKKSALPLFEKEISLSFSNQCVKSQNEELKKKSFSTPVHSREINLFFIENGIRYRIDKIAKNEYVLLNGKEIYQKFSKEELLNEIKLNPEKISPNVVLRPVYQECILPNLLYIGGSNEIQYWLQLKKVFEEIQIPYPLLQIRNSILIIDKNTRKKIEKVGLEINDIFEKKENLIQNIILKNSSTKLDFTTIRKDLNNLKNSISDTIEHYDAGLNSFKESEIHKIEKIVENIEQLLFKKEKSKHENQIQQILDIKNRLFPENSLQERFYNILHFCPNADVHSFLKFLYSEVINVLENDLILCISKDE
ncbi:MAG: bacillithiol biosynthesis cysteine-adding enzyme BshC [Flavobacteriia bacterium]|nr:bacillithiol biosynthesis cysteine-adding enzyme BshC [Flavobacteriia bacterium]